MGKTIMDSVMLSRFAKWAGRVFSRIGFKKKSCGASLCKSEKKVNYFAEYKLINGDIVCNIFKIAS